MQWIVLSIQNEQTVERNTRKKHKLKPSLQLTPINITFYYNIENNKKYFLETISLNPYD